MMNRKVSGNPSGRNGDQALSGVESVSDVPGLRESPNAAERMTYGLRAFQLK
jgi:hypothetical protein